jgi:sigma-E factor negative regulatory protein RseA
LEFDMSLGNDDASLSGERLSALLDGEADQACVVQACAAWREVSSTRATWHAYHLIGDVMRSEDLASNADRDAEFLSTLRARLAREPVVLAPEPAAASAPSRPAAASGTLRRTWRTPAAIAAGFVVVAGALVVNRQVENPSVERPDRQLAVSPSQAQLPATRVVVSTPPPGEAAPEPEILVANGKLIRDARLDRYLAAHKQFAGSSALGVPSAFLRSATSDAANR